MNCLIIHSDFKGAKPLEKIIKNTDHLNLVANCGSPMQVDNVFNSHKIDLIFIDEQAQQKRSKVFMDYLSCNKPYMIMVKSGENDQREALDFTPNDVIMKPISKVKFKKVVNKALLADSNAKNKLADDPFVFIKVERSYHKINTKDILYIQALADYVRILTEDRIYTTHSTMQEILDKLPSKHFIRVHRSYIIRIESITALQEGFVSIHKRLIPIGKSYKKRLEQRLTIV